MRGTEEGGTGSGCHGNTVHDHLYLMGFVHGLWVAHRCHGTHALMDMSPPLIHLCHLILLHQYSTDINLIMNFSVHVVML